MNLNNQKYAAQGAIPKRRANRANSQPTVVHNPRFRKKVLPSDIFNEFAAANSGKNNSDAASDYSASSWARRSKSASSRTSGSSKSSRSRSISPKSRSTSSRSPNKSSNSSTFNNSTVNDDYGVVMAIVCGLGNKRCEVGIAEIAKDSMYLNLYQFHDSEVYEKTMMKIMTIDPRKILLPHTMCKRGSENKLYKLICHHFPDKPIIEIQRPIYNAEEGLSRIQMHIIDKLKGSMCYMQDKYYALACANALLKYKEYEEHVTYTEKSMCIVVQGHDDMAFIDMDTATNLELVEANRSFTNCCLYGVLNHCCTRMGRKLLRASILQPLMNKNKILERQECIDELLQNRWAYSLLQAALRKIPVADSLLGFAIKPVQLDNWALAERNLNFILHLKMVLEVIPEVQQVLEGCKSAYFTKCFENLKDERYHLMLQNILKVVHPNAQRVGAFSAATMHRCFAIKPGIDGLLDVTRQAFCEKVDDLKELVTDLGHQHRRPFGLACNASNGYHIEMAIPKEANADFKQLPAEFIKLNETKSSCFFTTEKVMVVNSGLQNLIRTLHLKSYHALDAVLMEVKRDIDCLFQFISDVAELDVIQSLTVIGMKQGYVRPEFSSVLSVKEARHPIKDLHGTRQQVPNDIDASVLHNVHILTGPNMSGKSIYLRQILLTQVMAQIGCHVPAQSALVRIADRIFYLNIFDDGVDINCSLFGKEMRHAQYILESSTDNSLVALDELGKATSVEEGSAIAIAILMEFIKKKSFVFVATHYLAITTLPDRYCSFTNYHFETVRRTVDGSEDVKLTYTHKLKSGVTEERLYGTKLAKVAGFLPEFLEQAENLADRVAVQPQRASNMSDQMKYKRMIYDAAGTLNLMRIKGEATRENVERVFEELMKNLPEEFVQEFKRKLAAKSGRDSPSPSASPLPKRDSPKRSPTQESKQDSLPSPPRSQPEDPETNSRFFKASNAEEAASSDLKLKEEEVVVPPAASAKEDESAKEAVAITSPKLKKNVCKFLKNPKTRQATPGPKKDKKDLPAIILKGQQETPSTSPDSKSSSSSDTNSNKKSESTPSQEETPKADPRPEEDTSEGQVDETLQNSKQQDEDEATMQESTEMDDTIGEYELFKQKVSKGKLMHSSFIVEEPEERSNYGPEYIERKIEEGKKIVELTDSQAARQFDVDVKPLVMTQSMKKAIDSIKVSPGQVNFSSSSESEFNASNAKRNDSLLEDNQPDDYVDSTASFGSDNYTNNNILDERELSFKKFSSPLAGSFLDNSESFVHNDINESFRPDESGMKYLGEPAGYRSKFAMFDAERNTNRLSSFRGEGSFEKQDLFRPSSSYFDSPGRGNAQQNNNFFEDNKLVNVKLEKGFEMFPDDLKADRGLETSVIDLYSSNEEAEIARRNVDKMEGGIFDKILELEKNRTDR